MTWICVDIPAKMWFHGLCLVPLDGKGWIVIVRHHVIMVRANGWTLPKVSTLNLRYMIYVQTNVQVFSLILSYYFIRLIEKVSISIIDDHVYIKYVKY